ncbi:TPA: prepilin-type N-terminal cleavage/methylation domain-containing protein [Providencia rettgeri]
MGNEVTRQVNFFCQYPLCVWKVEIRAMGSERKSGQKGFTLIEILAVLFICSLTTGSGLYQWQLQLEKHRLIDAARQISEFIYSQVIEGIYLNRYQILFVKVAKVDWELVVSDANTNQEVGKMTAKKYPGIEISKTSRSSVQLYGKQGTSRAFSVELKNKNSTITVYMSALGRIRVCSHQKLVGIAKC